MQYIYSDVIDLYPVLIYIFCKGPTIRSYICKIILQKTTLLPSTCELRKREIAESSACLMASASAQLLDWEQNTV